MEPQIVDYYNELPHAVNVIDKMNEELSETQNENEKLKRELEDFHKLMNRFNMPRIKVDTVEEYHLFESKLEEFQNLIEEELFGVP
jgi:predicted RNase H-like nuclease (RuvC/YqgF family)